MPRGGRHVHRPRVLRRLLAADGKIVSFVFIEVLRGDCSDEVRQVSLDLKRISACCAAACCEQAPLAFSLVDLAGPTGGYIGAVRDGSLVPVTGVFVTSALPTGSVETYRYPSQAAPPGGVPPS